MLALTHLASGKVREIYEIDDRALEPDLQPREAATDGEGRVADLGRLGAKRRRRGENCGAGSKKPCDQGP